MGENGNNNLISLDAYRAAQNRASTEQDKTTFRNEFGQLETIIIRNDDENKQPETVHVIHPEYRQKPKEKEKEITKEEGQKFIDEVMTLCKKYNISLIPSNSGAFKLEVLDTGNYEDLTTQSIYLDILHPQTNDAELVENGKAFMSDILELCEQYDICLVTTPAYGFTIDTYHDAHDLYLQHTVALLPETTT